jgi:hypothetical protein
LHESLNFSRELLARRLDAKPLEFLCHHLRNLLLVRLLLRRPLPHPLLGFPSWEVAVKTLPLLSSKTEVMEKHRAQLQTWWAEQKAAARAKVAGLF